MMIGIDLGTTNSLAACYRDGKPEIIPNRLGQALTPSVVSVDEEGTVYVGQTAIERGVLHPLETARAFKRGMGTDRVYPLGAHSFRAEELSSLVLRSLKEDAEAYLGEPVTEAIISVPAYFNDMQRKATKQAGVLAGLTVNRIINEPTAAAIACGMGENGRDARYLVFDLGGGTFDVSILELSGPVMEVHAIAGDNFLGGEDFTMVLCGLFSQHTATALEQLDPKTRGEVFRAAESCKCAFSQQQKVTMACTIDGERREMKLDLSQYEKACAPLLERLRRPIERSLRDAGIGLNDIDQVVLVGGATRLPVVRKFVIKLFRRIPGFLVDPDQAVALGAAIQCGIKARQIREVVLTDVCPYTLGTEVMVDNGLFEESGHYLPIIQRNTVIPVSRTQTVYTAHDNQTRVNVKILQGESRMAYNNLQLGELSVPVPPGPKGQEAVEITYTYDVNALLEVEVYVPSNGARRRVVIQNQENALSEEEAAQRLAKLQYLKQNPRQEEQNRLLLLRGERLYEEYPEHRPEIDRAIMDFERALSHRDRREIQSVRASLSKTLDAIEFGAPRK